MRKFLTHSILLVALFSSMNTKVLAQEVSGTSSKKEKVELGKRKKEKMKIQDPVVYSGTSQAVKISLGKKSDYILIDWIKPGSEAIKLDNGYLDIKLKIFSTQVLQRENVIVFHNQERQGSKMDVSGLFGDQKEFNYTNRIALVEGANEIVVKVMTDKQTVTSEPLVIFKKGATVSVQPMGASTGAPKSSSSIYWWTSYDPVTLNGKPYTHKDKLLPVKFKILTTEKIDLSQCSIHHNEKVLKPRTAATLERDYQGNYSFADEVDLLEIDGLNEIFLEVKTPSGAVRSEKLSVNFSPLRPSLHILSIGTETNLQYTLKDAKDFARLFTGQGGATGNRLFNKIYIDTLIGSRASAQEIKGTIEELKIRYYTGSISPDDVILTFISSHGFLLDGDFRVQGDDYSPTRQRSTSVSFKNEVVGILEKIPCKKIVMIDACHSGGARDNIADINFEINKLNSIAKGLTVFASSRGEEQSYEDTLWQNGAFTESIIKGLSGGMADTDGNRIISLHELSSYVSKDVAAIVNKVKKRPQNPILVNDELGDVAIYIMDKK